MAHKPRAKNLIKPETNGQDFAPGVNVVEIVVPLKQVTVLKARIRSLERRVARLEGRLNAITDGPKSLGGIAGNAFKPDRQVAVAVSGAGRYLKWRQTSGY